jgi:hypothetical protein
MLPPRMADFIEIEVEAGAASADGVSLRFKCAGAPRAARVIPYESEDGLGGTWRVFAANDEEGTDLSPATAVQVEDSSDGLAWLVAGGRHGLVLEHEASGARVREAYLLLSKTTPLGADPA